MATFRLMDTPFCLVGHSNIPFICQEINGSPEFFEFAEDEALSLREEQHLIINPGSVGQPRGHDPIRASYAVYGNQGPNHTAAGSLTGSKKPGKRTGKPGCRNIWWSV